MEQNSPDATPSYLPVPDIAELLGLVVTRVHQLLRDRALIGVRRAGILTIPGEFIIDGDIVRGLTGTITVLSDANFSDEEIVGWLFAADAATPPNAMTCLREGRAKMVHRRAQIAGF